MRVILAGLALLFCFVSSVRSRDLLPCADRPALVDPPWVNANWWCLEQVIADDSGGELGFTALASAPGGTLYAARPLAGQVLALTDTDGDLLPDTPQVVAEGLTRPNGLAYADGVLYITGSSHLYRLVDGELDVLVNDLPAGGGFWTGGLTVGPDGRIYVAIGAPCDYCEPTDPARGSILSFAPDGSDRQVVARGLRNPGDVAFLNGQLWTLDTARDALFDTPDLDELNRVTPGQFYGWPYCIGADNRSDWPDATAFDCAEAVAPALTFPTHSSPIGLAAYTSDTFPHIQNTLLVVLNGSNNRSDLRGFTLAVVRLDEVGKAVKYEVIIPEQSDKNNPPNLTLPHIHYQGSGFWPHRPIDVTVSPDGCIYVSVGGGRILALRPR